jgi:primosomal protein N' (replication factor Y)
MDSDTMRGQGSHAEALERFRAGEVRILVGTQMIAKGLDFPNVTLVGVVNADTALHFPDFRAAERTFQLVTQVAGRTGRGARGGRVLVQTFSPDHPAIQAAMRHDYQAFATQEWRERQEHGYPPAARMARIIVRGPMESAVEAATDEMRRRLAKALEGDRAPARFLGPAPAPLARLRGKSRYHLLILADRTELLQSLLREVTENLTLPADVQWAVDVDPQDML